MCKKEVCPFRRAFFSLTSNYMESLYENIMVLIWKGGWNYSDLYKMPVKKRNWIFDKFASLTKEVSDSLEEEVNSGNI